MNNLPIIIASTNAKKVSEIINLFAIHNLNFVLADQEAVVSKLKTIPDIHEYGISYTENALIKAWRTASLLQSNVLSDDSGIEIDFLNGQPGIYSKRFLPEYSSVKRNYVILKQMENCPASKRLARYKCALCFVDYQKQTAFLFQGECQGYIAFIAKDRPNSFGYDPIFVSSELNLHYSEITMQQKNTISHRANAFKRFANFYQKNYL